MTDQGGFDNSNAPVPATTARTQHTSRGDAMNTNIMLIDGLTQLHDQYRERVARLRQELDAAEELEGACRLLLTNIKRNVQPGDGGQGLHAHIRPEHLAHCTNQNEAWIEIARLSGGFARPTDGAQAIIDAGLSNTKRRSVISSGAKIMIDSEDWERTDPGTYRYLKYVQDNSPGQDGAVEDEAWPAELYPSANGDVLHPTYQGNQETPAVAGPITA